MYTLLIILIMLVFPALSAGLEIFLASENPMSPWWIMGKWFVFWGVGIRLFLAGLKQIFTPSYTAQKILAIEDPKAQLLVQELGFSNVSVGVLGLAALFAPCWVIPAAVTGSLYYLLAGLRHIPEKKNTKEMVAMLSDFFIVIVLVVFCAGELLSRN